MPCPERCLGVGPKPRRAHLSVVDCTTGTSTKLALAPPSNILIVAFWCPGENTWLAVGSAKRNICFWSTGIGFGMLKESR